MFDVIDALELLGADADLARAPPADREPLLRRAGMEPDVRAALLVGDAGALHASLRAPTNVCCLINPAEQEEEEDEDEEEEGEEGEDDGDDEEDKANRRG